MIDHKVRYYDPTVVIMVNIALTESELPISQHKEKC